MEILEPIEKDKIPYSGKTHYAEIYRLALSANGLAVPVKFKSLREARNCRSNFTHPKSIASRLGLAAILRGDTVFVYRKDTA